MKTNTDTTELYNLALTKDQLNTIVECLLFSCSVNICADWKEKELRTILDIAKDLKDVLDKDIDLKNISFVEEENYEDSWTAEMHNIFANFYNVVKLKDV
jgi:hypothetical protein